MQADTRQLHPAAAQALDQWHVMVARRDMSGIKRILHPDAVFRSPMANSPYKSADALALILSTVVGIFQNFTYHRQFVSAGGLDVGLEFSARVNDRDLKGVDLIRFDSNGRIVEFEVMIRPRSGLQALGEEMGARLASKLPAFKV